MKNLFLMPSLSYQMDDLAPMISQKTMEFHYGKHLQAYIDNLNKLVPGTEWEGMSLEHLAKKATGKIGQNAGQAWNHMMYFEQFAPAEQSKHPSEEFLYLVEQSFGSMEAMQARVSEAAVSLFGSGWAWLVMNSDGVMQVVQLSNDDNPLRHGWTPILTIDVWEHAYYLDYQNRRADYVKSIWLAINWSVISQRVK